LYHPSASLASASHTIASTKPSIASPQPSFASQQRSIVYLIALYSFIICVLRSTFYVLHSTLALRFSLRPQRSIPFVPLILSVLCALSGKPFCFPASSLIKRGVFFAANTPDKNQTMRKLYVLFVFLFPVMALGQGEIGYYVSTSGNLFKTVSSGSSWTNMFTGGVVSYSLINSPL
jgi:hypothetical protein